MIGTTHFTNAVVEAQAADADGGGPARAAGDGGAAADGRLARARCGEALGEHVYLCHGGHEFDGRPISPLDRDELRRAAADIRGEGHLARSRSRRSSRRSTPSSRRRRPPLIAEECPAPRSRLSHEIGRIGLLERENATIMNACLRELATQIVDAFHAALAELGIEAPGLPEPERRHADERRLRRALPGGDVRLRPDELDARRRASSPASPTARSSTSAARPPTSAFSSTASRARPRSRSRSAACGRTSACRTCSRSGSAAGSPRRTAPRSARSSVGYELTDARARLRRRHADRDRRRRRAPGSRRSATRPACAGLDAEPRAGGGSRSGSPRPSTG